MPKSACRPRKISSCCRRRAYSRTARTCSLGRANLLVWSELLVCSNWLRELLIRSNRLRDISGMDTTMLHIYMSIDLSSAQVHHNSNNVSHNTQSPLVIETFLFCGIVQEFTLGVLSFLADTLVGNQLSYNIGIYPVVSLRDWQQPPQAAHGIVTEKGTVGFWELQSALCTDRGHPRKREGTVSSRKQSVWRLAPRPRDFNRIMRGRA